MIPLFRQLIRYAILTATTHAGSGHPTSSLSATELMCGLFFGGIFRHDLDRPDHPNKDCSVKENLN